MEAKDSNGNVLNDDDAVTLIRDLKVKGSFLTRKRGPVVKETADKGCAGGEFPGKRK